MEKALLRRKIDLKVTIEYHAKFETDSQLKLDKNVECRAFQKELNFDLFIY